MPPRILVVDDDKLTRAILKEILDTGGMEIAGEASDGLAAVSKYQELKPDAVIMDILMPDMDGVKAIRAILKIDPSAKIVICSILGRESMVREAISAGAKDYIGKPFKAEIVTATLKKVLAAQP